MNKYSLIILTIIFVSACKSTEDKNLENPKIIELNDSITLNDSTSKFKEYFEIEKIIELETTEKSTLVSLDKIIFKEDKIVILDKKFSGLKVFKNDGHYMHDISKLGQGPGEFTKIFDVTMLDSNILVYSLNDMKLGEFNLNGDFIRESKIPFFADYFTVEKNNYYFYLNYNSSQYNDKKNLLITDSKFNIKKGLFPYKRNYSVSFTGNLVNCKNNILYNDAFDGNVYKIENMESKLIYTVKLGKKELPIDKTNTPRVPNINLLEYDYFGKVISLSNQLFSFTAKIGDYYNNCMYFVAKDKLLIKQNFAKNDIYHVLSAPVLYSEKDSMYYSIITPVTLGYIKNNPNFFEELKIDYPKLYSVLSNLNHTSNPIIVFYKLK